MDPHVIVIAGPNGAGKTTAAPVLLQTTLGVTEFVNADHIAAGLSPFNPEGAALHAGRAMLKRIHDLARQRATFAFETTLASRSFAPLIEEMTAAGGYRFHLLFLALADARTAAARVAQRVAEGGHGVPPEVIQRRFDRGLHNFFELYRPLAHQWRLYDNTLDFTPRLIAAGRKSRTVEVADPLAWKSLRNRYEDRSRS